MSKKKVLALILAAATALASFPSAVFADGETTEPAQKKRVLLYKEDFEGDNPEIYIFGNYDNKKTAAASNQFRTVSETDNKAGAFYITDQKDIYQRVGYQFSDDGITSGEMDVKFRFKQGSGSSITWSHVLFGENNKKGSLMQLLCYNKNGRVKILDDNNKELLNPIVADTWYKYEAKMDLGNQKITASLKNNDDTLIKTLSDISSSANSGEFKEWPIDGTTTKFKIFGVSIDMVVDDIEIYCDPIEVTEFKLVRNDGAAYTNEASFLTARRGQLTFNHNAAAVEDGAVKIGEENVSGELSEDGKTYTFDIPSNLIGGKEYTVTVDQSKIKMKAVQQSVDEGTNLYGEGTKTYMFTPSGIIDFSEDFDNGEVSFYGMNNNGTKNDITTPGASQYDPVKYEQKADSDEDGANKYGHFSGLYTAGDVTDGEGAKYYGFNWGCNAIDFDENGVSDGKLKVHFRFRPTELTVNREAQIVNAADGTTANANSFGSVLIGNSDQKGGNISNKNDARGNLLAIINVREGNLRMLNVDGGAHTAFTDAEGNNAAVEKDKWYTCDAVLDLNNRSVEAKVKEDETGRIFKASATGIAQRTGNNAWGDWPAAPEPCFKSLAVLGTMDIDDIEIKTDYSPSLTATETKATAKAATVRQTNYMIIVQYDENDRIAAVEDKMFTLEEGQASVYSQDVNWADGAVRAKAFIWDNLSDANPLEKCAEILRPIAEQTEGTE